MKSKKTIVAALLLILAAGFIFPGGGSQRSQAGAAVQEAATAKSYPSNFRTSGSGAAVYNQMLDNLANNFVKYFTDNGEAEKIKGYDTPVQVRFSLVDGSGVQSLITNANALYGETAQQNRYFDAYKRAFNVEASYKFISSEYDQQLRLDMAANDLPDIFYVRNQTDLSQLASAGVIQELGSLRAKYNSKYIEECWRDGNNPMVDMATINGQLYGLPLTFPATDFVSYLWVRGDWLKALNLQEPKTMDDLVKVMEAFVNSDLDKNGINDTFGLSIDNGLYYSTRGIFTAFKAYPEVWTNNNGVLEWGGVNPNNKQALAFLADLYKRGFIDPEFISGKRRNEILLNGKCGFMYGGHWESTGYEDIHTLDPNADFYTIPIPTQDGRPVVTPLQPNLGNGWSVVNSKFSNPEIAYKIQTLYAYMYACKDSSWWIFESFPGSTNPNHWGGQAKVDSPWENYKCFVSLENSWKAGWDTSLIIPGAVAWYDNLIRPEAKWAWERMLGPEYPNAAFYILKPIIENNTYFWDAWYGIPSNYMQDRWQSIKDEQLVTFTKIITGDLDVNTGFDAWVRTFNSMGGDRITMEVNEWYKSR